jgi:hypothetical protein
MKDLRRIENLHVFLWLLKDMSWCRSWHTLGLIMVAPTLLVAGKIAWETRTSGPDFVHNLAVCLWICANITWMVGEFFFNDGTRPFATIFFAAGFVLLGSYYAFRTVQYVSQRLKQS